MLTAKPATIDLTHVGELIHQSEIDFRRLKANISMVLAETKQASIADILAVFPADQGLGSIVGLLALGSRYGQKTSDHEHVTWIGKDDIIRKAAIPKIFFLQEHLSEWA